MMLPVLIALLTGQAFAGDLPRAKSSELNGPASPHQLQVLGLGKLKGAGDDRSDREGLVNTYKGAPVSAHQLEVLRVWHELVARR